MLMHHFFSMNNCFLKYWAHSNSKGDLDKFLALHVGRKKIAAYFVHHTLLVHTWTDSYVQKCACAHASYNQDWIAKISVIGKLRIAK